uniref:Uncharacterized protein n=1 Tax=Peronospora matthiolae TaxID=2874970 RepID=A0AAV1VCV1_9STRA
MLQSFPYTEEILSALDDQVFEIWTAAWRRSCVQSRLLSFRARTSHPSTRQWLDTWVTKLTRTAPYNLPALTDSRNDWVRLRTHANGEDPILKLCDMSNRCRFDKHVICAGLYGKEIRVLIGQEDSAENEAVHRLSRHLEALKTVARYRDAFAIKNNTVEWGKLARLFFDVFMHGESERAHDY